LTKINPLDHPICFTIPGRLTENSAWQEHIPFAMFLVDLLRPDMIVELGTHYGDSYCAFCQAVDRLKLSTKCYAIDTWQGDVQSGFYGPEVLANLQAYHDPLYCRFSHLVQSRFDDALTSFSENSIGLLHIDGCHTYDAIKHDFEAWYPKVSQGGIILLHDIAEVQGNFGAKKYWEEIISKYDHFEFTHGHGLGVLVKGKVKSPELRALFSLTTGQADSIRDLFYHLGRVQSANVYIIQKDRQLQARDTLIAVKEQELLAKNSEIANKDRLISTVNAKIITKQGELKAREQELTSKDQELKAKTSLLAARDHDFKLKEKELKANSNILKARDQELKLKGKELEANNNILKAKDAELAALKQNIQDKEVRIHSLENQLQQIQNGIVMGLLRRYVHFLNKVARTGTRRRHCYDLATAGVRVLLNEGPRSLFTKAVKVMRRTPQPYTPDSYHVWIANNEPDINSLKRQNNESLSFKYRPKISIITPVWNTDEKWLRLAIESVINQTYDNWELCLADGNSTKPQVKKILREYEKKDIRIKIKFLDKNKGISGNSNEALSLATGEFIALMDHDDELAPFALYECVKLLNTYPETDFIYSDEDLVTDKGLRSGVNFKPNWSPDMFLSYMYICHLGVYRKVIMDEIGHFRSEYDGSQDYDFVLRFIEKTKNIRHIPQVLYHWRTLPESAASGFIAKPYAYAAGKRALNDYLSRNNIAGIVLDGPSPGLYRVKRQILGHPLVSIIIIYKDKFETLIKCIDSIRAKTDYDNYEIIIADNDSFELTSNPYDKEPGVDSRVRVLHYNHPISYSSMNNLAASQAKGEHLLFLDDNTEIITPDWLSAMLEHSQREEVGAVGAKLLFPDGSIHHCGVLLGIGPYAIADNLFYKQPDDLRGFGRIAVIGNYSAVSGACIMIRKRVFEAIGRFDEKLTQIFSDVDLCLRIRQKDYLITYTPYAKLSYIDSIPGEYGDTDLKQLIFRRDVEYMQSRWGSVIDAGDHYYNPNLRLDSTNSDINIQDCQHNLTVSVIIPTFNGSKTITNTLNGVLNQTYKDYEIIVVDDGSTDSTVDIVEQVTPMARIIRQTNKGTMAARQAGIEAANGDFIALLDQDDQWFPKMIEIEMEVIKKHSEIGLVLANMESVDENGKSLGFNVVPDSKCYSPSWEELLLLHPIATSTALFRKELVQKINGLDSQFGFSGALGDSDTFVRMEQVAGLHFIRECLGYYCWSEYRPGRLLSFLDNLEIYSKKYLNHPRLSGKDRRALRAKFASSCTEYGHHICNMLLSQEGNRIQNTLKLRIKHHESTMKKLFGNNRQINPVERRSSTKLTILKLFSKIINVFLPLGTRRRMTCEPFLNIGRLIININQINIGPNIFKYLKMRSPIIELEDKVPNLSITKEMRTTGQIKVLVIDNYIPAIRYGAGFPRLYKMLTCMADLGYVTSFFPVGDPVKIQPETSELQSKGLEVFWGDKVNFEEFAKARTGYYDIVVISRPDVFEKILVTVSRRWPKAAILYDAEALFYTREATRAEVVGKMLPETEKIKMARHEMKLIEVADMVISVAQTTKQIMLQNSSQKNIEVWEHIQDTHPLKATFEGTRDILHFGSFFSGPGSPNEDAVVYFAKEIFPEVRMAIPIKFYIVGSSPTDNVRALSGTDIEVTGYVEKPELYFDRCRVNVVPTRFAAGIPLKLIEAMSYGIPSVVSRLIAEQLGLSDGNEVLVAVDRQSFVNKVIELYQNESLWNRLRDNSLDYIANNYSYEIMREKLRAIIRKAYDIRKKKLNA
jgi:O-antigen biosynthesis protein